MGAAIILAPSEGTIPPTPAFSEVYINGEPVKAIHYRDQLYITTEGMITTTVTGKNVTMKLAEISCPLLQAIKGVDANGNLVCGAL